jgi:hypothetical protein
MSKKTIMLTSVLILLDVVWVFGLMFLRQEKTYEASMLIAYWTVIIAVCQFILCPVGFMWSDNLKQRLFYASQILLSLGCLVAAELGVFANFK